MVPAFSHRRRVLFDTPTSRAAWLIVKLLVVEWAVIEAERYFSIGEKELLVYTRESAWKILHTFAKLIIPS